MCLYGGKVNPDSILAMVQLLSGIPVGTVGLDNGDECWAVSGRGSRHVRLGDCQEDGPVKERHLVRMDH